ncbi:Signal transduction histidine kinase [Quadrisphaera granulorum]|uniref:histidine kinase n=1 Tax=Quadrisphaera granulorum TaxID=317664 RepID=A0A315ZXF6_9ACTN|nr:signal transduction histidine kinase [Quadrisphaera granulorum]SZE98157.1 Signal transduction histidine kinase [Quadrisphaera granulorum]
MPRRVAVLVVVLLSLVVWPPERVAPAAAGIAVVVVGWVAWLVVAPRASAERVPQTGRRLVAVTASLAVVSLAGGALLGSRITESGFAVAVVVCLAAGRDLGAVPAGIVWLAGAVGTALGLIGAPVTGLGTETALGYTAGLAAAALVGLLRGARDDARAERERTARALLEASERTRTEQVRAAALAERARIAREVHDVLGHSLGSLALQLEVVGALLEDDDGDPATRVEALRRVRAAHDLAASGIEETRRAVHALRVDAPPLPDALTALAQGARHGGQTVDVRIVGTSRPLGADRELALLRTAQEAMVNAAKHAPGAPVTVELHYDDDATRLLVSSPLAAPAVAANSAAGAGRPLGVDSGSGLAGLRERLLLVSGGLAAGPRRAGEQQQWVVEAEVPA